jgi:hypothetical protein
VRSSPADGEQNVSRRPELRIWFDRRLSPASVHRGTVRLRSGPQRVFLAVRVDPLTRAIVARPFGDGLLEPGTVYRLIVEGVRDLDTRTLADPETFAFRTSEAEGADPLPPRPSVPWGRVAPLFDASCASSGCHGSQRPALGLDLSSASGVRATAIGVASRQVAGGGGSEGVSPVRGLEGMRIIDAFVGAGQPETSYLMYKVLGDSHILGDPMPPPGSGPANALEMEQLRLLSDWIRGGAPTTEPN